MRAILVGNQNCGKTTIFNLLTGSSQKIGNWPGVTITKKSGVIRNLEMELVDLPGTYSLVPYTLEEKITYGYLMNEKYDLIVNVIDATSLERGLYLTLQLLELSQNMIIVLNMMDKLEEKGIRIHLEEFCKEMKVPVCMISANKGVGLVSLLQTIKNNMQTHKTVPYRLKQHQFHFEEERNIPILYEKVDTIYRKCVKQIRRNNKIQEILDYIFLHRIFSIPIFCLLMFSMYFLAIEIFGKFFSAYIAEGINILKIYFTDFLNHFHTSKWAISLLNNGIITGVGSVLSFIPPILMIFIVTSFLEASGYMARVAFLFHRFFQKVGLSGKSIIPFILGMGCSVSGILSSKVIEEEKSRVATVMTTAFIPCSAKLPMITLFTSYFFHEYAAIIATSFYFLSALLIFLSAIIFRKCLKIKEERQFVFELPEYKIPSCSFLWKDVYMKIRDFISKAGTVIFLTSLITWVLLSFSPQWEYGVPIDNSILAFMRQENFFCLLSYFRSE